MDYLIDLKKQNLSGKVALEGGISLGVDTDGNIKKIDESGAISDIGGSIDESRLLKVPTSADEGKLPVIRADKIPAVYHDTTLAAIVIEGDKVIDKISGKELTKVGSPQIIDSGIHSPTNSDYYMLELEGVEGLPVAVSFDYQGDESPDSSNIVTINGSCAYYSMNGVSFCRSQGGGNNIKIDNQPVGVSEAYRNYVMQVSSDNYESKMPPVAFIAGESKSPTYEGSFPAISPLSSVRICGRFGKIRNILIGSAFPYTGNFTPRGDGVEGFGVPEKREPGWNYETLDEAANGRLLPANPANGDIPCFDATATVGGGIDDDTHLVLHFDEESGIPADSSQDEILITANDTAADAATAKFGKARNLNNSYLSLTCPAMATGTGDFTYEGWFYFNELNKRRGLFGVDMGLYVALWGDNTFGVAISTSGSSWNYNHMDSNRSEATATQGVWQHIALVRNKGNVTLYLNGNSILSFDIGADTVITGNMGNNPFRIGYPLGGMSYVADFCDEFRFSTVARWTGNFTPPDAPYSKQVIEGEWGKLNKAELVKSVNGQTPDSSGAVTLPEATASAAGLMAATDKTALATLEANYLNKHAGFSDADMNAAIELGAFWGAFVENAPTSTSSSVYYALQNSPYGVHSGIVQIACQVASNLLFYRYFDKQNASGTWRRLLTDADWYSQKVNSASDFNAYKTPGNYFFTLASHLNSPYSPNTTSGWLVVEAVSNGEYIKQTHYAFNFRKTWIRTYNNNNSTWVAWHQQLSIADLTESKSRPGYFKLLGGTIVQWGAASNITADGLTQITFPVAFPNVFLIGNATAVSGNASASGVVVSLTAVLSTGMTLLTKNHPGNGNDINVHWLAIGY